MRHLALGVTSMAFLVGTTVDARAECKPAAVPVGDPVLVQGVTERLTAIGISTSVTAGCPAVHVHLERRGAQLHLRVADGYQRKGEREVRDVATAAAVIESWTLQEIEDGSLPAMTAPIAVVASAPPHVSAERASIALFANTSVASDTSAWIGGELAACVRVGALCLGGAVALAANSATIDDAMRGAQRSKQLAALATVEVPRILGRFVLSPGVGIGYGWMSFAEQHMDAQSMPFSLEEAIHSLRARAQLTLSFELGAGIGFAASLYGDIAALRTGSESTRAPRGRVGISLGLRFGWR